MSIGATAVWRIRTGGNNANGAAYDAGISGAGTDYSQQDVAQLSSASGAAAQNATAFTDAAGGFTAAMVGNALQITGGTNAVAGYYFVTGYTGATQITLDRAPAVAGAGSGITYKLGGGWADLANIPNVIAGNTIWVRGSGSNFPTTVDYNMGTATITLPAGSLTTGNITFRGENGRPQIASNSILLFNVSNAPAAYRFFDLCFAATGAGAGSTGMIHVGGGATSSFRNCRFDQQGHDVVMLSAVPAMLGCEAYSSVASGTAGVNFAVMLNQEATTFVGNNIHDTVGPGIYTHARLGVFIKGNIVAKCNGDGITVLNSTTTDIGNSVIMNNTIDANAGHGINFGGLIALQQMSVMNNNITNHATAGKYGIFTSFSSTTAVNDRVKGYFNFNCYFGNANDNFQFSYGPNDKVGIDPQYQAQATQGYNLVGTNLKAAAFPQTAFMQTLSGMTTTQSYVDIGAVQRSGTNIISAAVAAVQGISQAAAAAAQTFGTSVQATQPASSIIAMASEIFAVAGTIVQAGSTVSANGQMIYGASAAMTQPASSMAALLGASILTASMTQGVSVATAAAMMVYPAATTAAQGTSSAVSMAAMSYSATGALSQNAASCAASSNEVFMATGVAVQPASVMHATAGSPTQVFIYPHFVYTVPANSSSLLVAAPLDPSVESKAYGVDWCEFLVTGETINGSSWTLEQTVGVAEGPDMTAVDGLFMGSVSAVRLSGGTVGNTYIWSNVVDTTLQGQPSTYKQSISVSCITK